MNFDELPAEIQCAYTKLNEQMLLNNLPNKIKRHLPGFIEHDEADLVEVEFSTVAELLNIEWIRRWQEDELGKSFYKFSIKRDGKYLFLLAEMTDGMAWCLGQLLKDVSELPTWVSDERDDA